MIQPEQVFLHAEPVDMRWSMDRLSLLIQQIDGRSPCDGTAYGFTNRNYPRLKLLIWDGTGVWLCHRRLHQGRCTQDVNRQVRKLPLRPNRGSQSFCSQLSAVQQKPVTQA